jgi:Bacterial membrane protein YfhO
MIGSRDNDMKTPRGYAGSSPPSSVLLRSDWLFYLLFLSLPPALFYNVWISNGTLSPGDGFIQFLPFRILAAQQWSHLSIPLWNPYIFSGFPLAAEIQAAVFYPPNLLFLLLPPILAQNLIMSLHFSLAGIFTFVYARANRVGRWPAFLAGATFMFSGFITAHRGHTSMQNAAVWVPLLLYLCKRWKESLNVRYIVYAGFAYGLLILAGDTKVPILAAFLVAGYLSYFAIFPVRRAKVLWLGLLLLVIGSLISALQILPTWELANLSVRRSMTGDSFFLGSLSPWVFPMLVFPYLFGATVPGFYPQTYFGPFNFAELTGYVGILPMAFAAIALSRMRKSHIVRFWFLAAMAGLFLALGQNNPLYKIFYFLPLYNKLRIPARALLLFDLAVSILAGLGLDGLLRLRAKSPVGYRRLLRTALSGTAVVGLGALLFALDLKRVYSFYRAHSLLDATVDFSSSASLSNPAIHIPLLFCLVSLAVFFIMYRTKRQGLITAAIMATLVLDLFFFAHFSDSAAAYTNYWFGASDKPETLDFLRRSEPDFTTFRVLPATDVPFGDVSETVSGFQPNMNMFSKVSVVSGFDPLVLEPYQHYVLKPPIRDLIRNNRLLSLLGVKYVVASRGISDYMESGGEGEPVGYERVFQSRDHLVVYRNLGWQPRAFWVDEVRLERDVESAWNAVMSPEFDPRHEVVIVGSLDLASRKSAQNDASRSRIEVAEYADEHVHLVTDTAAAGVLVLSQTWYPGWHAYVDGEPVPVYPADVVLSGIVVKPGRHAIDFKFESRTFRVGLSITLISAVACALVLIRKNSHPAPLVTAVRDRRS